ncbi:hypothetical protein MKW98_023314 [Papaver atlanticum]|uniref:DUF6570 domain-containing protein n=1 Tax=Papaver atlanticum TaxID=357466 RepID=A0AAD4T9W0_9MAGN|nr:hypothetical protein MKW98_023314 [Papaver atlanticum]
MVPGDVPDELSRLTDLEKILIARVHPYKYGGNVINFVQDVIAIAKVLPCKPKDLSTILVVKRTGNVSTKEFIVRREYVRQALKWLQKHDKYYPDIEISEENIDALPEEGVPCDLPVMDGGIDQQGNDGSSGGNGEDDGCDGPPELQDQSVSIDEFETVGTIGVTVQPDQERNIRRALENDGIDETNVDLPFTGEVISEFTTVGYISMAFPALFPDGSADLREPRVRKVPDEIPRRTFRS